METEPEKPPKSNLSLSLIESTLSHSKKGRGREKKMNDKEKHAEKDLKNMTVEMNDKPEKDKSKDSDVSNVNMMQNETFVGEESVQNEAGNSDDVNPEQQHVTAKNEEEQKEDDISVHMTNEETKDTVHEENGTFTDIHETKHPECETDHLQDQYDARTQKDILTEKPSETNDSELVNKVFEFLKTDRPEFLFGAVCKYAHEPQDDTDHKAQNKGKESQPESIEKRQSIEAKPNNEGDEHLYEIPDIVPGSPAENVKEMVQLKEQLKQLDNITLHIAVTGSTGAGKSTFINAIRGLQPDDATAAPTGVTETTMAPTEYQHPTMPNVKFWDLPGTGSPKFKAKKYLKDVKLETFDFFIIISSERFKENDIMLARAIKEKKKLFYFIRSKIDNDIYAESQMKDFDEPTVLSQIRQDCHANLKDMDNPNVFLISSFELHRYDFQTLVDTLKKELPTHKREALVLSLPIYSSKVLEEKIEMFRKKTRSAAVASGSVAVAPVPGLSMAVDASIWLGFFTKCYYAFGLDDVSIEKLSVRANNPSLKDVRKSPLVLAIRQKKLSNRELSALVNREAAVKFAWSMVPVVGSRKTAEMSYSATLNLLQAGLQDLADTAREVLKVAGLTGVY